MVENPVKEIDRMSISILALVWVGLDVSKDKLDAAIWLGGKRYVSRVFDNDAEGLAKLAAWAKRQSGGGELRFCMESTGDYHTHGALYLTEMGFYVAVVNPARIKHFGRELGRQTKTDKADARLIAQFGVEREPAAWPMKDPARRTLLRLARRRGQVQQMISRERCHRECPEAIGELCMASIGRLLKELRAELRRVEQAIRDLIQGDARLRRDRALLASIPGLGEPSMFTILAEMPPVEDAETAASYAASTGVQSTWKNSGSKQSATAPMSRAGRRQVRRALFMTAFVLRRKIPQLASLYHRLRERGRKHRQALVACLRKLLMIVYGVLKGQTRYEART